jgi:hypothetical protein
MTTPTSSWSERERERQRDRSDAWRCTSLRVLAIALQGRAAARHTINGFACAIGFETLLAVPSRHCNVRVTHRLNDRWHGGNQQSTRVRESGAG